MRKPVPSLQDFRRAVATHLGQTLTPELAAYIEHTAGFEPPRPLDLLQFTPAQHERYVIGVERFAAIVGELHALHAAHWSETERHRHGLPLAPDYDGMVERERAGRLLQFTVRLDGVLVGNLRLFLVRSSHTGTTFAEEDTLYLRPEHRGGFLAMRLLRYAEAAVIALGVREIRANSKLVNRADVLMRRMGYTAVATQFVKLVGVQT